MSSRDLEFVNNSKSNNNNLNVFSSNSSFNNSKLKMNNSNVNNNNNNNINNNSNNNNNNNNKSSQDSVDRRSTLKDLTYVDKFKFIKDCLKKVEDRELNEYTEMSDLKQYEKTFLSKIKELKDDICELTNKIYEVKIAKSEVDKKIKYKEIFLNKKLSKSGESSMDEENEDIYLKMDKIKSDIESMNNEMKELGDEIQVMSEQSLDTHQDIESLKKKSDELIKNNFGLIKNIQKKEKLLAKMTLDNKKLNDKITQQEINSEKFLKGIEKWANKKSNVKYNNLFDVQDEQ